MAKGQSAKEDLVQMGRFREDLLERVEDFAHRVADVAESLDVQKHSHRVVDQLYGCGTSLGANTFEADEAMSRADFCKGVSIVLKELAEARFWLRFVGRRRWINPDRLLPLEQEALELKLIFGAILTKSRRKSPK